jgi:hypothetical protein
MLLEDFRLPLYLVGGCRETLWMLHTSPLQLSILLGSTTALVWGLGYQKLDCNKRSSKWLGIRNDSYQMLVSRTRPQSKRPSTKRAFLIDAGIIGIRDLFPQ